MKCAKYLLVAMVIMAIQIAASYLEVKGTQDLTIIIHLWLIAYFMRSDYELDRIEEKKTQEQP